MLVECNGGDELDRVRSDVSESKSIDLDQELEDRSSRMTRQVVMSTVGFLGMAFEELRAKDANVWRAQAIGI